MRRQAITAAAVLLTLAVFIQLIPSASERQARPWWATDDEEVNAAETEYRARVDSASALSNLEERMRAIEVAARLPKNAAAFSLQVEPGLHPETREAFTAAVQTIVDSLGADLQHPVRVVMLQDSIWDMAYGRVVVLPRRAEDPCVVVIRFATRLAARVQRPYPSEPLLGACAFYARYGMPGRGMQQWLDSTRGRMAKSDNPRPVGHRDLRDVDPWIIGYAPEVARCVAGSIADCRTAWDGPGAMPRWTLGRISMESIPQPSHAVIGRNYDAISTPFRNLGDLRRAMGDERFADVWRSEQPPAEAYETAMGESIAEYARGALLTELKPYRPGPLDADAPTAIAITLSVAATLATVRFALRQRSD